jgi:hypothetical protein
MDKTYEVLANGLRSSPELFQYGIAINEPWHLFICLSCQQGYHLGNAGTHLRSVHQVPFTEQVKMCLARCACEFQIQAKYPSIPPSQIPTVEQIAGIAMIQEYGCPGCPIAGSKKYIQNHLAKESTHRGHNGVPVGGTYTQTINKGNMKVKIRVLPSTQGNQSAESNKGPDAWIELFRRNLTVIQIRARQTPNARYISPWLMRTGWHELVEGHDIEELRAFVDLPKAGSTLAWIHPLVSQYLNNASALIAQTSMQTLQRINSSDPDHQSVIKSIF